MLAAALVLGLGVEVLRRQTRTPRSRDPPPPDLGADLAAEAWGGSRLEDPRAEPVGARCEGLGELHQQGVLTDEEFAAEKAKLVSQ